MRPAEATGIARERDRIESEREYETQQDDERRTRIADGATREAEDRIREVIREELDR